MYVQKKKGLMPMKHKEKKDKKQNPKSAGNNQWTSTGYSHMPDNREQRNGPGGE